MSETSAAVAAGSRRDRNILLTGLIIYGIGQSLLYVIFGPLARATGLTETQFGILIAASNLALIFSAPRWGLASDGMGRRIVFIIGLLGFAVGYGALAFGVQAGLWGWVLGTPLFFILLVARLVYGVFAGGVQPAAAAYIADTTDESSRAKGMALVAASGGIGSVLGPFVGTSLAELGELAPMYIAAAAAIGVAIWARVSLTEPTRHVPQETDGKLRFTDQRVFPYLVGWFMVFMVFTAVQVITAFFIADQFQLYYRSQVTRMTGLALLCMGVATVLVQVVVMQKVKLQPKLLLRVSLILFGGTLVLLAQVQTLTELCLVYALMGVTVAFAMPSLSAAASLSVQPSEQGAAAGLLAAAPTAGMVFGPVLGAALYEVDRTLPMYAGAAVMVLTGIYYWFVKVPTAPD